MSTEQNNSSQTNNEVESSTSSDGPIFSDPFDFSENKPVPLEEQISFELNDDGDLELSGLPDDSKDSEGSEESASAQKDSTDPPNQLIPPPYEPNPFDSKDSGDKDNLLKENKELRSRLEKLESTVNDTVTRTESERALQERREKLESANFTDEQIDVILEITGPSTINKSEDKSESKEDSSDDEDLDYTKTDAEVKKEIGEVFDTYNGRNGTPSVQEMKPFVDYVFTRLGNDLSRYPIKASFRLAENAPFIQYLDNTYPDKMKSLTIPQIFEASENLRRIYYQSRNKPINTYDHLRFKQDNNTDNTDNTLSNDEVQRLANEKSESSKNVPGGEVETEEEKQSRARPKSAREVATASLNALYGD